MKNYGEVKNLPFDMAQGKSLKGISDKTIEIHWGKLYQGYVKKWQDLQEKLKEGATRDLKVEESFLADAVILHEAYFDILGGDGNPEGKIAEAIKNDFGSLEKWQEEFKGLGMVSRGWVILAYDFNDGKLRNYIADNHNSYGIWGAAPIVVMDMYEHAYFIDFGSDKKSYIETYFQNLDWQKINDKFSKIVKK